MWPGKIYLNDLKEFIHNDPPSSVAMACIFLSYNSILFLLHTVIMFQAMRGKTYEVSSYRRNSRGSLTEERQTMNTSVDVSRYFNFNYYQ